MLKDEIASVPADTGSVLAGSEPAYEIELKLVAPAAALAKVREASVIQRHACNAGVVRHLEAVYYDTADHALCRHGLSLRVREAAIDRDVL